MSRKLLWTLRESPELTAELWSAFRQKVAQNGYAPGPAIVRLIRRYVAKGFDDGHVEQGTASSAPTSPQAR